MSDIFFLQKNNIHAEAFPDYRVLNLAKSHYFNRKQSLKIGRPHCVCTFIYAGCPVVFILFRLLCIKKIYITFITTQNVFCYLCSQ